MVGAARGFGYWQKRILWGATAAYTVYYFCRVNISIAIPFLQASLGASKTELGIVASALQISYGVGKFVNGIVGDRSNPRYFMAAGLLLSGLANLAFSRGPSLGWLIVIWALNGWFQSMGFPSGARLLSHYYERKEHGRTWTLFGTSHQVGACVILIAGGYLGMLGWRNIFAAPGLFAVAASAGAVWVLRDVPYKNRDLKAHTVAPPRPKLWDGLRRIVGHPCIWAVAFGNFFLYIVRYGLLTWSASYLISTRGMSAVAAGWMLGLFEFAGLFGGLSAGWISDLKSHGRRGPVMTAYMLILAAAIAGLWFAPAGNRVVCGLAMAACGFFVYGPLMLVSVAAAGYVETDLAASSAGLAGLLGYVGATLAGAGLGATAQYAGWAAAFSVLVGASILSAACFGYTARPKTALPLPIP